MIPRTSRRKQAQSSRPGPDIELTCPANDDALVPPVFVPGPAPACCPCCHRPWFDLQTSRMLELVVDLHEALGTATAQVSAVRAMLAAEVLP
jgi:hypothetical protein